MSLSMEEFHNFPDTLTLKFPDGSTKKISIVVPGRKPSCWTCHQMGHIKKNCPTQKKTPAAHSNPPPAKPQDTKATDTKKPKTGTREGPAEDEDGFVTVQYRKGRKSPKKHIPHNALEDYLDIPIILPFPLVTAAETAEQEEEEEEEEVETPMEQGRPAVGNSNKAKRTASKISTAAGAASEISRKTVKGKRRVIDLTPAPTETVTETSLQADTPSQTPDVQREQGHTAQENKTSKDQEPDTEDQPPTNITTPDIPQPQQPGSTPMLLLLNHHRQQQY